MQSFFPMRAYCTGAAIDIRQRMCLLRGVIFERPAKDPIKTVTCFIALSTIASILPASPAVKLTVS